jgi:5-formyltetrahydrofolate cyclo-ligase
LNDSTASAREKRELRASLRAQRLALPAVERMRAAEAIVDLLLDHPVFAQPGYVAGYWAMGGELPLHVLQMRLREDQVWCLPCIQPDDSLRFAPWRPGDELLSNRFGIPEPALSSDSQLVAEDLSIILLPLLGFTRGGQRLGMGGGFYDRSLAFRQHRAAPPFLIGVGYGFQELPDLPADAWDVRLDAVLTEREFLFFPSAG